MLAIKKHAFLYFVDEEQDAQADRSNLQRFSS